MSTTVRITETYDLKTTINKIGLIGVHTPSLAQVNKLYPGLAKNHKFIRVVSCDVVGACASVMPADPQQIGLESGDISPEDMFNPILYKAVSNESFDTLVNRIYNGNKITALDSLTVAEIDSDAFNIYYSQLADSKRWKKSMPQRGFALRGLYPICYTVINTFGNVVSIGRMQYDYVEPDSDDPTEYRSADFETGLNKVNADNLNDAMLGTTFKGKSVRMPRIPLHSLPENIDNVSNGTTIPKTFVCAILVPPARLNEFYYRMRVSWTIRFEEVCSTLQTANLSAMGNIGRSSRVSNYGDSRVLVGSESVLENESALVDTNDVSIKKIMES